MTLTRRRVLIAALCLVVLIIAAALWPLLPRCGWEPRYAQPALDDPVAAMTFFSPDGQRSDLWVGGYFLQAGVVPVSRLAKWDGQRWIAPPGEPAFNAPIRAMTVFDDVSGPALIIAGQFTQVRGLPVNYIVQFDGKRWTPLGEGFDHWVLALEVFDDGSGPAIYAGGLFTQAGGRPARHIAKWNGAQWINVGGGIDGPVNALRVHRFNEGPARRRRRVRLGRRHGNAPNRGVVRGRLAGARRRLRCARSRARIGRIGQFARPLRRRALHRERRAGGSPNRRVARGPVVAAWHRRKRQHARDRSAR